MPGTSPRPDKSPREDARSASPARELAFRILRRVERRGAYASILLQQLPSGLEAREAALVTELVYGTLRHRFGDEHRLERLTERPLREIDPDLALLFRMAAHQILRLERIPERAAVHQAVEAAKHLGGRRGKGGSRLLNAVLRRLCAEKESMPLPAIPDPGAGPEAIAAALSIRHSHPVWMIRRWLDRFGLEETGKILEVNNTPAPVTVSLQVSQDEEDGLRREMEEDGLSTAISSRVPGVMAVTRGVPTRCRAFEAGRIYIQDEASAAVPRLLDPPGGARVLDACAAPGGKSLILARLAGPGGLVIAGDIHPHRLGLVRENARRAGASRIRLVACDGATPPFSISFDRILVDAPCTGTGVLRRDVEARYRLREEELGSIQERQLKILAGSAALLAREGILIYSVCSIEPEEGPGVIRRFLSEDASYRQVDLRGIVPALDELMDNDGAFRSYPHRHGMDGFYAAGIRRA